VQKLSISVSALQAGDITRISSTSLSTGAISWGEEGRDGRRMASSDTSEEEKDRDDSESESGVDFCFAESTKPHFEAALGFGVGFCSTRAAAA
jgi:hypothetical protein